MGACERCSRLKEKCSFDGADRGCCRRCRAVGSQCTARRRKRMGRPPTVSSAAGGLFSVFVPLDESSKPSTSDAGAGMTLGHGFTGEELWQDKLSTVDCLSDAVSQTHPVLYSQTRKSQGMARNVEQRPRASETTAVACPARLCRTPSNLLLDAPWYTKTRSIFESSDGFFKIHRHFMLGESFLAGFHRAVWLTLEHAPTVMSEAYASTIFSLQSLRDGGRVGDDSGESTLMLRISARCLKNLESLASSIKQVQSAAVVAMLGQIMMVHSSMMPISRTGTVTRRTLWAIKPWMSTLMAEPDMESICLSPLFVDTIDSLLRRQVPVVRMPETQGPIVDRFGGLTAPLLTMLYDLCVCSHRAQLTCRDGPMDLMTEEDPYTEVESRIGAWDAELLPTPSVLAADAGRLLDHARLYRLASLLVIHRLRYPLGVEDQYGQQLADEILGILDTVVTTMAADGATGLGLDFPLLVAMMERPQRGEALHRAYDPLRYRLTLCSRETIQFVRLVRAACESGFRGLWLDLVPGGLPSGFVP